MWHSRLERLDGKRVCRWSVRSGRRALAYAEAVTLWQQSAAFVDHFIGLLADCELPAYFWETPPISAATWGRSFEFVQVDSPMLAAAEADPLPFRRHFERTPHGPDIVSFPNLGRDAFLIAPCPRGPVCQYAHLAAFSRAASRAQNHSLWAAVGAAVQQRLADR